MDSGSRSEGELNLVGTVERVTYRHPESLYTVVKLSVEKGYRIPQGDFPFAAKSLVAVGYADNVAEGLRLKLWGRWDRHKQHGVQFAFDRLEVLPPESAEGLAKYLASSAFEGIGETLAQRIVQTLGPKALEVIRERPEALERVRGLRPAVREKLVASVRSELASHKVLAFLRGLGLGPWQASAIVRRLGPDCEQRLRQDPYLIASGISGIGFATADRVARNEGIALDDPRRLRAALVHSLKSASDDGHSLLGREELLQRTRALLEGADEDAPESFADVPFLEALDVLAERGELVIETDSDPVSVYLPWLEHSERHLADNLAHLMGQGPVSAWASPEELAAAEEAAELDLDEDQRSAVLGLLASPVALLTGGPGVGKTTIIRLVVSLALAKNARIELASPTGRAAKRLAEATGREAKTIHRMLGYEPMKKGFAHDERTPIEADLVVIDEISMLDVILAHHLVKAVEVPTRIVFVGDPNQLPSVGPGNVLAELLSSERIPAFRLKRIYRQGEHSLIVENAHRILSGERPRLPSRGDLDSDFYFFPAEDPESCAERLVEVVTKRVPANFGLDWVRDVQVIAPMYRGACGVDALNERLREELGSAGREVRRGSRVWRTGDRVIHTRNDYDKEVFNGDMGHITSISSDGSLIVRFPEREVNYTDSELNDLQPAFAITVHRSQGGEFPAVVVPLVTQHFMMLQRFLLYTAITRARKLMVLVGSMRAMDMAIDNADQSERQSRLAERLASAVDRLES